MDCRDYRNLWQELPGSAERNSLPEWGRVRLHLSECANCRHEFAAYEAWESRLAQTITDVAIPAGLLGRLQERLADENTLRNEAPLPLPRRSRAWFQDLFHKPERPTRRMAVWKIAGATVAVALLVIVGLWQIPLGRHSAVDLHEMVAQLTRAGLNITKSEPFSGSFQPKLPSSKEMLYPADLKWMTPKSLVWRGREVAAVYSFAAPQPSAKRPTILLVVFSQEQSRFTEMPRATSFQQADFQYVNDRAVKVWWQDGFVYCCFATEKGTEHLEQLRPSVYSS